MFCNNLLGRSTLNAHSPNVIHLLFRELMISVSLAKNPGVSMFFDRVL